jgi:hypothetical protein
MLQTSHSIGRSTDTTSAWSWQRDMCWDPDSKAPLSARVSPRRAARHARADRALSHACHSGASVARLSWVWHPR